MNEIYERDLGINLQLVANNDQLISLGDAATDPFTNNNLGALLDENRTEIDNTIGSANYDIGHVFCTEGGGLAQTPAVCSSGKARGASGLGSPVGENFNVSILSHELGHQFGANHTQSSNVNENFATAMEPGSGSTIMSYAGVAPPNIQNQSDAMFHYISISEISNRFTSATYGSCAEEITTGNDAPVIQNISNYTIPKSTPFKLEADATDANGDALTYSWDQIDNNVVPNVPMPPESTSTSGPLFRTFLPVSSPVRYLPSMSTLLNNQYSNTWEVLPSVARTINFGVIVRDNNALGGQSSSRSTTLTVTDAAGPFRVTSQAGSNIVWGTNDTKTITWDVANTDDTNGVNSQAVDILLTTDGGANFTTVLASNTPNDGSENITVPNILTSNARVLVRAADNVFFDLNSATIEIVDNPPSCISAQGFNVGNVLSTEALISWIASQSNPSNDYDYVLITDGSVPDGSTTPTGTVAANATSVTLNGLTPNTEYDFYLRTNCGSGDLSEWSAKVNFKTTCSPVTAPFTENFDGATWVTGANGSIDNCWRRTPEDASSNFAWRVNSGGTASPSGPSDDVTGGGQYLYTEASGFNFEDTALLKSPPIDLSTLSVPRMKLSYHMFGFSMGELWVEVKDINATNYTTLFSISGEQQTASTDPFIEQEIDLNAYAGQTINIRIIGERGSSFGSDIAIDQFIIEETTDCNAPDNLTTSIVNLTSVNLSWDVVVSATNGYEWVVMADGNTADPANAVATGTVGEGITSAQVSGLNSNTNYDAYVRSSCGLLGTSNWSLVADFFTGYCQAGADGLLYSNISRVVFNTIDNSSTNTGYSYYNNISTTISRGDSYLLEVYELDNTVYIGDQVLAWIDFNQDGDFSDAGEKVIETASYSIGDSSIYPFDGNINIPSSAKLGPTTMRVRLNNAFGDSNTTPCGNSTFGEVEDYTVVIYDDYVYYDNVWTPGDPSGVFNGADNVLVVDGETSLTENTALKDLTVLINGQLNVEGILQAQGDIDNDGGLVFKSNVTTTGQLDSFTGSITGTGSVTTERHLTANRGFRFLASPVNTAPGTIQDNWQEGVHNIGTVHSTDNLDPNLGYGTHITGSQTGANGFDATINGEPSLMLFHNNDNTANQEWYFIDNTDNSSLEVGKGYNLFVRGDRSVDLSQLNPNQTPTETVLRATGTLSIGDVDLTPKLATAASEFSFLGNPYQAIVDFSNITSNDLTDFLYVWDTQANAGDGTYETIAVSSPSAGDPKPFLQPGQSFFVQNSATVTSPSLTFTETAKNTTGDVSTGIVGVFSDNTTAFANLELHREDVKADVLKLRFEAGASNTNNDFDATKLANPKENLGSILGNNIMAVERRDIPQDEELIPLFINQYQDNAYAFRLFTENWETDINLYIIDDYLETTTLISPEQDYSFSVDNNIPESMAYNRFSISFEHTTLNVDEEAFAKGFRLYPNPSPDGSFTIKAQGLSPEAVSIRIHNILGQQVFKESYKEVQNGSLRVKAGQLATGVYTVNLKQGQRNFTTRLIIK